MEFFRSRRKMALLLLSIQMVSGVDGMCVPVRRGGDSMTQIGGRMKPRWMSVLLIVALVGWVGVVSAQQAPAPAPAQAPAPSGMPEKTIEGKIKTVDQAKKQVTLEDGTTLTIPASVKVEWTSIKPGAMVMVSYVEAGQLKTVRKFEVRS